MKFSQTSDKFRLVRTTDPAIEPVSLTDLQSFSVINSGDDALAQTFIRVARAAFEEDSDVALIEQTWELELTQFYTEVQLPKFPFRSIESVEYIDSNGNAQTFNDYTVDNYGLFRLARNVAQPGLDSFTTFPLKIVYTVGFYAASGDPLAIDKDAAANPGHGTDTFILGCQAISFLAGHLYDERSEVTPVQLHQTPIGYRHFLSICKQSII